MILTVETNVSKELFVRSNADDLIDYVSWELSKQIAHEVNKVTEVETEFNKDNFSHTFYIRHVLSASVGRISRSEGVQA